MLQELTGRSFTQLTPEGIRKALADDFKSFTKEQIQLLEQLLEEFTDGGGVSETHQRLRRMVYKREPVDMRTFVLDPYYLGETCRNIYPVLLDDLEDIFAGNYREIIFTGAIGVGKCIPAGVRVYDVQARTWKRIEDLLSDSTFEVESLAHDHGNAWRRGPAKVVPSGYKICGDLLLRDGRHLALSLDHPVLTPDGWVPAEDLKQGSIVACSRRAQGHGEGVPISDSEVAWYGYLVAAGANTCMLATAYEEQAREFAQCVADLSEDMDAPVRRWTIGSHNFVYGRSVQASLDAWGLDVSPLSVDVSERVWSFSERQLALFLNRFLASKAEFGETSLRVLCGSPRVLRSLQRLLWRVGVHSEAVRQKHAARLCVEKGELEVLLRFVGPLKGREGASEALRESCAGMPLRDSDVRSAMLEYHEPQKWWFDSDIVWESVVGFSPRSVAEPVYDVTAPGIESFVAEGVLVHNTFVSAIGLCRVLYELSCMNDPQGYYGLSADSSIALAGLSANENLAKEVVLKNVIGKVSLSPYFKEHFPFKPTEKKLRFPNNIMMVARATTPHSMLGMNILAAILDEANFMPEKNVRLDKRHSRENMAKVIYDVIQRRMFSRYGNNGKLFLPSSKSTVESFISERISEARVNPTIFVRDYCLSGDTVVPLLDGTEATLKALADKYEDSDERFWVYSFDTKSGRIVPGKAYRPRLTAQDEETLLVTLDSGEGVQATPWHPFMMKDGTYKRADELEPGDSLKPFYGEMRREAGHFRPGNHKVVSVRKGERCDVYDLSVEEHENFAIGQGIFVHNSLWDVKPDDFSQERFWVLCGNEQINSQILTHAEAEKLQEDLPDRTLLVHVPETLRSRFESDLEGSLRDLAGVATVSMSPFIQRVAKLKEMIDEDRCHPFTTESFDPSKPGQFVADLMVRTVKVRDFDGRYVDRRIPIQNPRAPRAVHIDPALSQCSAGLCLGHMAGSRQVQRQTGHLEPYMDEAPQFVVDFILEIVPPPEQDLDFGIYEYFVMAFVQMGFPVRKVTADQYQAEYLLQRLEKKGFEVGKVSMDRTWEPYQHLKQCIYENRVSVYEYPPLMKELRSLEANWSKRRIEKPAGGSKDISDALAGCLYSLKSMQSTSFLPMLQGVSSYGDGIEEDVRAELALLGGSIAVEGLAAKYTDVSKTMVRRFSPPAAPSNFLPPILPGFPTGFED